MKSVDNVLSTARPGEGSARETPRGPRADLIDAINQVFAEFELAYHNQFHKAFAAEGSLQLTKKYWLGNLTDFSPELLKRAARHLVQSQEFLPTLAAMIAACENGQALFGLPTAEEAYREACLAPEPKSQHAWSHPAVFHAAAATGWYVLANETQAHALPQFSYYYTQLCRRVMRGESLQLPAVPALPEQVYVPLSPEQNRAKLKALRNRLDL